MKWFHLKLCLKNTEKFKLFGVSDLDLSPMILPMHVVTHLNLKSSRSKAISFKQNNRLINQYLLTYYWKKLPLYFTIAFWTFFLLSFFFHFCHLSTWAVNSFKPSYSFDKACSPLRKTWDRHRTLLSGWAVVHKVDHCHPILTVKLSHITRILG